MRTASLLVGVGRFFLEARGSMACGHPRAGLCVMVFIPAMFVVYRAARPPDIPMLASPDGVPILKSV
ncbi:MAG: hypothetical protein OSB69_16575 [Alphaproteobacteria bacterium]|nr:hypothetical protein [Alphaproteobacteria bacterium]